MSTIRDEVDRVMSGSWVFTGLVTLPANSVDENTLKTASLFPADNLVHRFAKDHRQKTGTAVASVTEEIHIAAYAGIVDSIEAVVSTVAIGNATVTIDLQKSTGGAAFATVLTSTFVMDSTNTVRVVEAGAVDATKDDYVAGDVFRLVVTSDAGTGTQAEGLNITVFFEEQAV
jgi:hypothetical protein